MPLADRYLTVEALKAQIGITGADPDTDAALGSVLDAASRQIDAWCGRSFGKSDEPESVILDGSGDDVLELPDVVSLTELAVDDGSNTFPSVVAAADYLLWPRTAPLLGRPYTELRSGIVVLSGTFRLTGIFGWPAVPAVVVEATALQANRLWARRSAPFGVVGSPELGQMTTITRLDPDVQSLLGGVRRLAAV